LAPGPPSHSGPRARLRSRLRVARWRPAWGVKAWMLLSGTPARGRPWLCGGRAAAGDAVGRASGNAHPLRGAHAVFRRWGLLRRARVSPRIPGRGSGGRSCRLAVMGGAGAWHWSPEAFRDPRLLTLLAWLRRQRGSSARGPRRAGVRSEGSAPPRGPRALGWPHGLGRPSALGPGPGSLLSIRSRRPAPRPAAARQRAPRGPPALPAVVEAVSATRHASTMSWSSPTSSWFLLAAGAPGPGRGAHGSAGASPDLGHREFRIVRKMMGAAAARPSTRTRSGDRRARLVLPPIRPPRATPWPTTLVHA